MERITKCGYFDPIHKELSRLLDPCVFIGRAPQQVSSVLGTSILHLVMGLQVEKFLRQEVDPAISRYQETISIKADHKV